MKVMKVIRIIYIMAIAVGIHIYIGSPIKSRKQSQKIRDIGSLTKPTIQSHKFFRNRSLESLQSGSLESFKIRKLILYT